MKRLTRENVNKNSKLKELYGPSKSFMTTEVPTARAVLQCGFLLMDEVSLNQNSCKRADIKLQVIKELATLITNQWHKSNCKFIPPVIITEASLIQKVRRLWDKAENICWGRVKSDIKVNFLNEIDSLFDVTVCPHSIFLCKDADSGCKDSKNCQQRAHIVCCCPLPSKIPVLELEWLYYQRIKKGERSQMYISSIDVPETRKQEKYLHRKAQELEKEKK